MRPPWVLYLSCLVLWCCLACSSTDDEVGPLEQPDPEFEEEEEIFAEDELGAEQPPQQGKESGTGLALFLGALGILGLAVMLGRNREPTRTPGPSREELRAQRLAKLGQLSGGIDRAFPPAPDDQNVQTSAPVVQDNGESETPQPAKTSSPHIPVDTQTMNQSKTAEKQETPTKEQNPDPGSKELRAQRLTKLEQLSGGTSIPVEDQAPTNQSVSVQQTMSTDTGKLESGSAAVDTETKRPTKDTQKSKPKSPQKEVPIEEQLLLTLSKVFDIKIELTTQGNTKAQAFKVLHLTPGELPTPGEDMVGKVVAIFDKRMRWQYDKVKFLCQCYRECEAILRDNGNEVLDTLADCVKDLVVPALLEELKGKSDEKGDLWSDGKSGNEGALYLFLSRAAGWSDDGVNVTQGLLAAMMDQAAHDKSAHPAMVKLVKVAVDRIKAVKRMDEILLQEGTMLTALDAVLSQPGMTTILAAALDQEVEEGCHALGIYFEQKSILGALLSLSTIVPMERYMFPSPATLPFMSLRGFPKPTVDDLRIVEQHVHEGLHRIHEVVHATFRRMMKTHKETVLAWIAAILNMNELRTTVSPQMGQQMQAACGDGYMLNLCAVLLHLCMPIVKGGQDKLTKVDPAYSKSQACRLNYEFETCLAGGQIVSEESKGAEKCRVPEELQGQFNFMTEIFHLTQRALNIGLIPALAHHQRLNRDIQMHLNAKQGTAEEEMVKKIQMLLVTTWDCCLNDAVFVQGVTEFYLAQSRWLQLQLDTCQQGVKETEVRRQQKRVFSQLPEFLVKDMATWFRFVVTNSMVVHPSILQGIQLSPFVDCCVTLLERPDLMPGPIPASKIVGTLLAFTESGKRKRGSQGWGTGIMTDLAAMVHTCPSVQTGLGSALLHTYVSVDVVEGLDVDKDDFDKYGSRFEIAKLLESLWQWQDCRASVLNMCGTDKFQAFLGAILDTLLYQLHDSLARLANVRKIQKAKEDEASWRALSVDEREEKQKFLTNEERVGKSFMNLANSTLGLIDLLTQSEEVCKCFTMAPLSQRSASAVIGFIGALCGPKASELKVKDMEKYNFNPRQLLLQIVRVILRIGREEALDKDGFIVSMSTDTDYSPKYMEKACSVLARDSVIDPKEIQQFQKMLEEMNVLHEAAAEETPAATPGSHLPSWAEEVEALQLDAGLLAEKYVQALGDMRFDAAELQEYHSFQQNASEALDPRSPKVKALMKEIKQLQSNLPVHPGAAVFVRQDEDRMDMVRALVTGPVDTPYSLGCFVFDVYFPDGYPNRAPVVKLITTGNGTVRFNPNLYADGKVCLSLLGTWHGGDASEKWNPKTSTLYQVLVSIQSLILISDPMYNEPGYDGMKGTAETEEQSAKYNNKLQVDTVRWAMLHQIRQPPVGFEDVIRRHFFLQKEAVLQQCCRWLRDCRDEEKLPKLRRAIEELKTELDKLEDITDIEEEEEDN
ncbi:PREDICTED: uncharacterized protein LOC109473492 [Branchiostoma belcheri]|uniref:Uncharacterized protein LOC109473492 n=2 Tax=Branchiostoma TaxID=7737 RepID=A0A6P4YX99_BRABE|nr:PREDICTED: uncharacterized protein LOC109473492 [Branchiostoma belcheri]